jgi:hypothetical protein
MRKFKHKLTGFFAFEQEKTGFNDNYFHVYLNEDKQAPKGTINEKLLKNSNDWEEMIDYPIGTKVQRIDGKGNPNYWKKTEEGRWDYVYDIDGSRQLSCISESEIGEVYVVLVEKPIIFITNDGVGIKEGDQYFYINKDLTSPIVNAICGRVTTPYPGNIYFSTKGALKKHIINYKRCLNLNAVIAVYNQCETMGTNFLLSIENLVKNSE